MSETPKESPLPTDLARALGDTLGVRPDGKPDLGALVVPLLRSGAGAALIGSLLGASTPRERPEVPVPMADPHPRDGEAPRHGGAGSPLAAIVPPATATIDPRASTEGAAALLAALLAPAAAKR